MALLVLFLLTRKFRKVSYSITPLQISLLKIHVTLVNYLKQPRGVGPRMDLR